MSSTSSSKMETRVRSGGRFSCKRCKKRFKTKGGLNLHLKQHNPQENMLMCLYCDFFTFQKGNLTKHLSIIHRKDLEGRPIVENLSCAQCNFLCFTDEQLKNHTLRKHTPREEAPFKCSHCEYATVEKAALEKHLRIRHSNERPFPCELCGAKFATSSSLARHRRSHEEVKPYQCHLCAMKYADKKRLRDHLMRHSNLKPFSCPNCKYATNRKDNLKTHIKRNHMPPENGIVLSFN